MHRLRQNYTTDYRCTAHLHSLRSFLQSLCTPDSSMLLVASSAAAIPITLGVIAPSIACYAKGTRHCCCGLPFLHTLWTTFTLWSHRILMTLWSSSSYWSRSQPVSWVACRSLSLRGPCSLVARPGSGLSSTASSKAWRSTGGYVKSIFTGVARGRQNLQRSDAEPVDVAGQGDLSGVAVLWVDVACGAKVAGKVSIVVG